LLIYVFLFPGQQPDGINTGISGTDAFLHWCLFLSKYQKEENLPQGSKKRGK